MGLRTAVLPSWWELSDSTRSSWEHIAAEPSARAWRCWMEPWGWLSHTAVRIPQGIQAEQAQGMQAECLGPGPLSFLFQLPVNTHQGGSGDG